MIAPYQLHPFLGEFEYHPPKFSKVDVLRLHFHVVFFPYIKQMPASVLTKHQFFSGSVWFASEMKALSDDCERFMSFLPGHIYSSKQGFHLFML